MKASVMDKLQRATDYLSQNAELRHTLGIPKDALLEPHFLGRGEHNDNFVFEDPQTHTRFVLRVNRASQPFHANQVAYEFAALNAVKPSGCTPDPLYLDDTHSLIDAGVLVTGFCEGDELNFDSFQTEDLEDDLNRVAHIMANIHAVPVLYDCPLYHPQNPLLSLFDECIQRFETYLNSAFEDPRITDWVKRFIAASEPAAYRAVPSKDCTHIINTETLPSHFLLPHGNKKTHTQKAQTEREKSATNATNRAQATEQSSEQTTGESATNAGNRAQATEQTAQQAPGFFVDWERPLIGEVAQDVAYFASPTTSYWDSDYLFTSEKREAFIEQYWSSVDGRFDRGSFDERFEAWLMMTALRSTTWCCKALISYHTDPETLTPKAREKLPVYLSDEFMELLAEECFHL